MQLPGLPANETWHPLFGEQALGNAYLTVNVSSGFKWGFGAGFPTRAPLRVTAELTGEFLFDSSMTASAALVGVDGSLFLIDSNSLLQSPYHSC